MKAVLFDLGGVLIKVHFDLAMERLRSESGFSRQELENRIFSSGLKEQHDRGLLSSYEFYERIIPKEKISFSLFQAIWSEIFIEDREMIDYLTSLAGSYPLYLASNTDPIHYHFFCKNYAWFSLFRGFGLSFRLRELKPSPGFYRKICREFNLDFKKALFVDDTPENVEAAHHVGLRSHLFTGLAGFQQFLGQALDESA